MISIAILWFTTLFSRCNATFSDLRSFSFYCWATCGQWTLITVLSCDAIKTNKHHNTTLELSRKGKDRLDFYYFLASHSTISSSLLVHKDVEKLEEPSLGKNCYLCSDLRSDFRRIFWSFLDNMDIVVIHILIVFHSKYCTVYEYNPYIVGISIVLNEK